MRRVLLACLLLLGAVPAIVAAAPVASIESPGHVLAISVVFDSTGRPGYTVTRHGKSVIGESRLGFLLTNGPPLERNFKLVGSATRSVDTTWEQPWGERRYVRNHYNELRVRLQETSPPQRELDVVFRVYDDGVGFRYEFPDQPQLKQVDIADELTEFDLAEPATAWWIPAGEWNRYEYLYQQSPAAEVSQAHTPATFRTASGLHLAIHEAALVDYAAMWLRRVEGQRFKATLAPSATGPRVVRQAPFATPWRTILVADTAGGLYTSNLELNLNEPDQLGGVSWFRPFKYVGIWWSLHLQLQAWAAGPEHGATTANAEHCIDFAAANGFGGVLVEGWNKGWNADWFGDGSSFSFTEPYPDYDLDAVAAYARRHGVHLIAHNETAGNAAHYEAQLGPAFDLYERLGIDSIKTGYVADGGGAQVRGADGQVRYAWHDSQAMVRHYLKVVTEAAKRHIAVDTHEPVKDTGLRRTYPNWVSREGARGMEYNAWGNPPNPPSHVPTLVFTRMLSGPMDYTPGVLSLVGRNGQRIQSTIARQLALYVVIYSPIQMAADLPENYARFPRPFQFIKDVPVDWDETRVLNGEVGEYVTIARKDRNSDDWYVGAVTDDHARTVRVPLEFLSAGRHYTARLYRDAPGADWKTNPFAITIETRAAAHGDTWEIPIVSGGGFAIRFQAQQ